MAPRLAAFAGAAFAGREVVRSLGFCFAMAPASPSCRGRECAKKLMGLGQHPL
jgi:hypothetical protein